MMRPNKIGWVLVGFFLIAGIGFWIAIPGVFIGQIWVAVAVFLPLLYAGMNRRADRALDLQRTGIRGEARIIEMTQTGVYVNEQPRVKLKLAIQAPGVAPFEDERTETVPLIALGRLTSGTPLAVYMRAEDPHAYVIDWFGGVGPQGAGGMGGVTQQAVLRALQEHGVDVAHQVAVKDPAVPIDDEGEPLERLTKLQQLRDANLISAGEFEKYRKDILEEI